MIFGFYSTNGKLKDWEDVVTRDQLMNSDSDVPILVIGTKHDLESQRGTLPGLCMYFKINDYNLQFWQ